MRDWVRAWGSMAALAVGLVGATAAEVRIETREGERLTGELSAWRPGRSLDVTPRPAGPTDSSAAGPARPGPRTVPWDDLLTVEVVTPPEASAPPAAAPGVRVVGRAGWRLSATGLTLADDRLTVPGLAVVGDAPTLPLEAVAGVVFRPAGRAAAETPAGETDRLTLVTPQGITTIEGLVEAITADAVAFTYQETTSAVPRATVAAIAFADLGGAAPPDGDLWTVETVAGAILVGREAPATPDPKGLRLTLAGTDLTTGPLEPGQIVRLTRRSPSIVPLATLEPTVRQDPPLLAFPLAPARDEAVTGGPLTIAGERFAGGVALQAGTALTFVLPPGSETVVVQAGLDDAAGGHGDCVVTLAVDGRETVRQRLRGGEPARTLTADIAGGRRLTVAVEPGERFDLGDHVDLGSARLLLAP